LIVEEKLVKTAEKEPHREFTVVIWGGIISSECLYEREAKHDRALKVLDSMGIPYSFIADFVKEVISVYAPLPAIVAKVEGAKLLKIHREANALSFLYKIEPVKKVQALLKDTVPMLNVPEVWKQDLEGKGVKVGIVDTGVEPCCSLEGKVVDARSFVPDEDPKDLEGHGTYVAGIAAGDEEVYRGVAPGAQLISAKVLDSSGSGMDYWTANGMVWAFNAGAQVLNLSLGGPGHPRDLLSRLCDALADRGVVVVVAAGNEGLKGISSPGTSKNAITVGATDKKGKVAWYSSRGPVDSIEKPDLVAPGGLLSLEDGTKLPLYEGVISARSSHSKSEPYPDDCHTSMQGTSAATPHVCGAAAILVELANKKKIHGNLHYIVKNVLVRSARDLREPRNAQGAGLLDVAAAVRMLEKEDIDFLARKSEESFIATLAPTLIREVTRGVAFTLASSLMNDLVKGKTTKVKEELYSNFEEIVNALYRRAEEARRKYAAGLISWDEYYKEMMDINEIARKLQEVLRSL